ncbi:MAG: aldehyde dehydrogenase family protein [Candidatus Omnitrophica bacterium]|nr:aldehyde dehydrogenase family protein [Candidatus Omnitrophota bacterium]
MDSQTTPQFDLILGGKVVSPKNNKYFDAINPSTGEVIAKIADASTEDVIQAVKIAKDAFRISLESGEWNLEKRSKALRSVADLIRIHAKELAELESLDTGKTLKQTTFIDIPTAADTFEYFSNQTGLLEDQELNSVLTCSAVTKREPYGVVAAILPWNYPLIMAAWKIAPALLCGNSVILKPSSLASLSLMHLGELITQSGLFGGMLNILSSSRPQAGEELAEHQDVDMVSFSGGSKTGQKVMRSASASTKKIVLELGGKSPNIVFADADMDAALGGALSAIFMNQGQMCTAGSRLLLEDSIYDVFVDKLVRRAQSFVIGNALDFQTEFGPVISREHRDRLLHHVAEAIQQGAQLLCGGKIPDISDISALNGFYIQPTIFGNVDNAMGIAQEEVFGPVLCIMRFKDEEQAIKIANDSKYGLAAMIWSKDQNKAKRVAGKLNCGTVWINTYGAFDNEIPFGGFKQSGFGRELGKEGVFEFTQSKQIVIDETPGGKPLVCSWF